jgi:hypothetical protein
MAIGPIPSTPDCPGRRHVTFSPTQLRVYRDCPERYFRQYIARERLPASFNRGTLRGSTTHKVIATCMNARANGESVTESLQALAERFLPRHVYEKAGAAADWQVDVEQARKLAAEALAKIPLNALVISVEKSYGYIMPTSSRIHGVELIGKVDLLLRHGDDCFEHIEFKTGWAQPDPYQEVICRIGICDVYDDLGLPILSTTMQLSSGAEFHLDGDREVLRVTLAEIEQTVLEIWSATDWQPRENARCAICNYAENLCSLKGGWARRTQREPAP